MWLCGSSVQMLPNASDSISEVNSPNMRPPTIRLGETPSLAKLTVFPRHCACSLTWIGLSWQLEMILPWNPTAIKRFLEFSCPRSCYLLCVSDAAITDYACRILLDIWGSSGGDYEDYCPLGSDATFRTNFLPSSSVYTSADVALNSLTVEDYYVTFPVLLW